MPSGEGPLPTKRAMHTNHQTPSLTCREAAQFNEPVERMSGSAHCQFRCSWRLIPVAHLCRSACRVDATWRFRTEGNGENERGIVYVSFVGLGSRYSVGFPSSVAAICDGWANSVRTGEPKEVSVLCGCLLRTICRSTSLDGPFTFITPD